MCEGPTCKGDDKCPMMQLPGAIPLEKSCGNPPHIVFPQTFAMIRQMGMAFQKESRCLNGQLQQTA